MTDYAAARRYMVDGQVRTADVTDLRILAAMQEVPRERFVPPQSASLAYLDRDLAVTSDRRLLKPMVLGKLLQAAEIKPEDRVLDVGCGMGYAAALLARMAKEVIALDEDPNLIGAARAELALLSNIQVTQGPLVSGWPPAAPYDVVLVEGAVEVVPETLFRQLANGGRLVCVLGSGSVGKAMFYCRSGHEVGSRAIFDAAATVLPGFAKKPTFAFQ